MAGEDLTVEYDRITDEQRPQADGSVKNFKRVEFRIGKFGPFVERIPAEEDFAPAVRARVDKLRGELLTLPR